MHTDILSTHTHTYTWLYSPFMRLTWWRLLFLQLDCWYFPFHFCWLFTFCSLSDTHTFIFHWPWISRTFSLYLSRSHSFAGAICEYDMCVQMCPFFLQILLVLNTPCFVLLRLREYCSGNDQWAIILYDVCIDWHPLHTYRSGAVETFSLSSFNQIKPITEE